MLTLGGIGQLPAALDAGLLRRRYGQAPVVQVLAVGIQTKGCRPAEWYAI